jgi:N-acyl-D-aspartate/D-glutamate deacylase
VRLASSTPTAASWPRGFIDIHTHCGFSVAPALGLADRGLLAEGQAADVVLFDPATIIDRSTYDDPHQYPAGIGMVIVNGTVVIDGSEHTGTLRGRLLSG